MQIEECQVGLVSFKNQVGLTPLQKRMAQGAGGRLNIDWGDFVKHHWNELASAISTIDAQQFLIWQNWHPTILKELSTVRFPNLIKLVARGNTISSLQNLSRSQWPILKELDLSDNLIVSTKSLAKIDLTSLAILELSANPIINNNDLFRCNFYKIAKVIISTKESLNQKFKISTDPVVWKIKLPHRVQDDHKPSISHRVMRRRMVDLIASSPQSLDYQRYHEMYSRR